MGVKTEVAEKESEDSCEVREYVLKYKSKGIQQLLNFKFAGEMAEAIERGREHCSKMRYRFIYVDKLFVDLDQVETRYLKNETG